MDRVTRGPEDLDPERIRANLERARAAIGDACRRAGRDPAGVELLVATKYVSAAGMEALARGGVTLVGENRAQELAVKHEAWGDSFTWDFIGRLQSNKVRQVLPLTRLIHSVDSISTVREIDRRAPAPAGVLLQVNISGEGSKCGIIPDEVDRFLEEASGYQGVNFMGLMTMPPLAADPGAARSVFASLRELAAALARKWSGRHSFNRLSMGTSNDYAVAVEEGATIIRLGNVIFD
ncbi:MAG: YggS family pyridoxal phosphate-dependent enzyme [Gaiellales bacterium]|nr:MAG: YggS family pyridoxal phosphate-dependent enzyme [Gaiellales bacterium]